MTTGRQLWLRYRKNHDDDDDDDDDDGDDDGDDGDDNDEYVERRRGKLVMVGGDRRADVQYEPMWMAQIVYYQPMSNLQTVECFSFSYKHWVVLDLFSVFSVLLILVCRNLPVDNIQYAVYLSKCTG